MRVLAVVSAGLFVLAAFQVLGNGLAGPLGTPSQISLFAPGQDLEGRVGRTGLDLWSSAEGEPILKVRTRTFGRDQNNRMQVVPGQLRTVGDGVWIERPGIREEFQVTNRGIRQDWVIENRPSGDGALILEIELEGARDLQASADRLAFRTDGNRCLVWHSLLVQDACGRTLPAGFYSGQAGLAIRVDDRNARYPIRIDPTFSDDDWVPQGGVPSIFGPVLSMVEFDGGLVAAGEFSLAGPSLTAYIARWTGLDWDPLGAGLNGSVSALAVDGTKLYVGGSFTAAGGSPAARIACWDGFTWTALGSGFDGEVKALHMYQGALYAAGSFAKSGTEDIAYIARWDGSAWANLGVGLNAPANALAVFDGNLVVGGSFNLAGGLSAEYIATWNGTDRVWSPLGLGVSAKVNVLFSWDAPEIGPRLIAGGSFHQAGGEVVDQIAMWNGSTWSSLGGGVNGWVNALGSYQGDLIVGGLFSQVGLGSVVADGIARWDGMEWHQMGGAAYSPIHAILQCGDSLYAGGYTPSGWSSYSPIHSWNGLQWESVGNIDFQIPVWAVAVEGESVVLAEHVPTPSGAFTRVLRKNGSSWQQVGGIFEGGVYALAIKGAEIYAGGAISAVGGTPINGLAHWDGESWNNLDYNGTVADLEWHHADLAIAGNLLISGGGVSGVVLWNGASYETPGSGISAPVTVLESDGINLYAGGDFLEAGGISVDRVTFWDGTAWNQMGSGSAIHVNCMEFANGSLFIGDGAGTVRRWDGSTWSDLGASIGGSLYALLFRNETLFAAGGFEESHGAIGNCILAWDGSAWSRVGSGVLGAVLKLDGTDEEIYAVGYSRIAGGKVSYGVSKLVLGEIPQISSSLSTTAQIGVPFVYQTTASSQPTGFQATGLPSGLTMAHGSGIIGGTPIGPAQTYSVIIQATDEVGRSGSSTLRLTVLPAHGSGGAGSAGRSPTPATGGAESSGCGSGSGSVWAFAFLLGCFLFSRSRK